MNASTKTRAVAYATSFLIGLAMLAQVAGLADYDATTGMFDLHPVSVYVVAGMIAPVFSAGLALLAVVRGWGGKK